MSTINFSMSDLRQGDVPWGRSRDTDGTYRSWFGELISADGCDSSDFDQDDVDEIIAWGVSAADAYDGDCAGFIRLKDGRYVAWESGWGPTGSGFCQDAYGGTADIVFANDYNFALRHISEKSRELLQWTTTPANAEFDAVMRDAWLSGKGYHELLALARSEMPYPEWRLMWLIDTWNGEVVREMEG